METAEQARPLSKVMSSSVAKPSSSSTRSGGGGASGTNGSAAAAASVSASVTASMSIGTKPTLVECQPMRFLIMDAPRQANLHVYIKELRKHHVTDVVRVCEPTYHGGELHSAGICLHEMEYKDGTSPSKELIVSWLQLVEKTFYTSNSNNSTVSADNGGAAGAAAGTAAAGCACIAVHCVAGLGRAPVLVAIALIEFVNMDPVEAVSFLRQRRRGAINEKQLLYLEGYKKFYKRKGGSAEANCCVIL